MKVLTTIALIAVFVFPLMAGELPLGSKDFTPGTTPVMSDRIQQQPILTNEPVWKGLEQMPQEERENSEIELILGENATDAALQMAYRIENLWNNGKFEDALALFPEIENLTNINEMAIGNAWRTPVQTNNQCDWGSDVRIGNHENIFINAFDIHRASGNLFAVLLYPESSQYRWAMNFSSNGGQTWSETYYWWAGYELKSLSASVVANHCYVGFGRGSSQDQGFLYRFKVTDGTQEDFNNGSSYITVFTTTSPDSIQEVSLTSNQDYYNNRLYYLSIISSGELKFFWSDTGAITWTEITTGVTHADRGLDACCNEGFSTYYLLASYLTDDNKVNIDANNSSDIWTNLHISNVGTSTEHTAIGAYHDTLLCAYDYHGASYHLWIRYLTSYDEGSNWYWGFFDDTTTTQESPDVTCRAGGGEGVIYRFYTPTRELRYTWRNYHGGWSGPVVAAENEPYYNKPCIEYLGSNVFGVVYLCWSAPYTKAAYFTRSDWTGIAEEKPKDRISNSVRLAPNPSRDLAKLSYSIKNQGNVKISLYDVTGRMVNDLVNEIKPAGEYTTNIASKSLAPGIYFIKVNTPDGDSTERLTIVK